MEYRLTNLLPHDDDLILLLGRRGIGNSSDVLAQCDTPAKRTQLARDIDTTETVIDYLATLSDLVRIRSVDAATARLLAGFGGVKAVQDLVDSRRGCQLCLDPDDAVGPAVESSPGLPPVL